MNTSQHLVVPARNSYRIHDDPTDRWAVQRVLRAWRSPDNPHIVSPWVPQVNVKPQLPDDKFFEWRGVTPEDSPLILANYEPWKWPDFDLNFTEMTAHHAAEEEHVNYLRAWIQRAQKMKFRPLLWGPMITHQGNRQWTLADLLWLLATYGPALTQAGGVTIPLYEKPGNEDRFEYYRNGRDALRVGRTIADYLRIKLAVALRPSNVDTWEPMDHANVLSAQALCEDLRVDHVIWWCPASTAGAARNSADALTTIFQRGIA